MRIYFYHMVAVDAYAKGWRDGSVPGHLLYGMNELPALGIGCLYHAFPFNPYTHPWKLRIYNLWKILSRYRSYDAVYGVTHTGLEPLIFLRALGLFRKPVVIWHHTAVIVPKGWIRRLGSALFYRGIDRLVFFSEPLREASVATGKVRREDTFVLPWGADLAFYDRLIARRSGRGTAFISTGRENRDFVTLIRAFAQTGERCDIYTTRFGGRVDDYERWIREQVGEIPSNVRFHIVDATHLEMAEKTNEAYAIAVCCLDFPYTVGLTSLVEALALGLPVVATDNPTFPFDVEKEGVGIKVAYGDAEGWAWAIRFLRDHPEEARRMGEKGRRLAENRFNIGRCAGELAALLRDLLKK